ncbi:MAG TPA: hypothetical protein VFU22_05610 [Roseiflexaceae bacterium]|nr:hypothetical protein [Roseiflexaceae bacterium]
MQHSLMVGANVRCADGQAGTIGGLVINPNRNHVDYVIVRASTAGEHEYLVPSSQIQRAGARELSLPCNWSDLHDLAHPQQAADQTDIFSNIDNLIVAREQTTVRDVEHARLGMFHGAIVDSNLEVQAILLADAPERAIPIERLARHPDDTSSLVLYLAQPVPHMEETPML